MPGISVVILSYNKFSTTTGPCLESVHADPAHVNWQVIVVDNASDADTRDGLAAAGKQHPALELVLNPANLGFSGGMNVGLQRSRGDVTVLLNSDTRVALGMVEGLAAALTADPGLGIVAPISNAAGNEQKIWCSATDPDGILAQGLTYARAGGADVVPAYRLDFCCVALSRHLIQKTGILDEAFGRGYYEDFDYCLRARDHGFRPAVVESAFLYHQGSASFASLSQETRELIRRNKKLLIRKHGRKILMPHVRDANLAVLRYYSTLPGPAVNRAGDRIHNRLTLAGREIPRGLLKRWRYRRALQLVTRSLAAAGIALAG